MKNKLKNKMKIVLNKKEKNLISQWPKLKDFSILNISFILSWTNQIFLLQKIFQENKTPILLKEVLKIQKELLEAKAKPKSKIAF
jgi:hypothetical protein